MKIQIERGASYRVMAYEPGQVMVVRGEAEQPLAVSVASVLTPDQPPVAWDVGVEDTPSLAAFEGLLEFAPELVLYGSGARLRFPGAAVMRFFNVRRIGFETMDTYAACRTYNVLSMEGRRVVAAMLIAP
jgi:uncharacterized protein